MPRVADRKQTRYVTRSKAWYIFVGAAIGFAVPLILLLLLSSAISQSPDVLGALILILSLGSAAVESVLFFMAPVPIVGGLIGYWVWKAKVESGGADGG